MCTSGLQENLEVTAGLEPAKTGFADQRLGHFGIATSKRLYPRHTQTVETAPRNSYLPLFLSLQPIETTSGGTDRQVLQTYALPLGFRAHFVWPQT